MTWDENFGAPTFSGGIPLDTSSRLSEGEHVTIRKADFDYEVSLDAISASELSGTVRRITPPPAPEESGTKVGETVQFKRNQIFTVYRQ